MTSTATDLRAAARNYREIAERHETKGRHRLARNFRDHADDCERRADALQPTT